uniref:Uncharacterized protein n=1 Tax=Phaseolus vulgaris TaxID=3885 RepID=V7BCM5_PHAVU|nr:hypothetical protein PHAVU_007G087300g [Phaseolus vulgaris]ESW15617.1 hypothetical protein PHAVU_007G087300g [Phaseolus vulgaris]
MFNTGMCNSNIRCNHKDKAALLKFKQGIEDPAGVLFSWSTQKDCCEWKGVMCDNFTSRVTHLSLPCSTTLPTYIDTIDRSHCLTGSVYLSLFVVEFEFLYHLNLSNNNFSDIQFGSLDCHNLSIGAPSHQCVNSSVLRYLDLSFNHGAITKLHMRNCHLKDLSPSLQYANFTALKVLSLPGNGFHSKLPKWLFNLSGISSIDLGSNFLEGQLPEALLNLQHLEILNLNGNHFNGPIPHWLGEFEHLQHLNLRKNMFSGSIPTSLGNLSSLIFLAVSSNRLTGVVSEKTFARLSQLKDLAIFISPPLIFDFDSHWIPHFQLERLILSFSGPKIPVWLYTQKSLEYLSIYESSFEAKGKFWNFLSRMKEVHLEHNSIDGNLSNVVLNSTFISLSSNDLKGRLPRLSSNVVVVRLSNNSLSGNMSSLLCDDEMLNGKSSLVYLDISLNLLSGGLTNCWENWKSLIHVNLGSNSLTGMIPSSMGLLSNLTSFHIHENKLYGEIPSFENCYSLLIFNVRENNFSGNIPNWIPHGAKVLQLRSNYFTGNIPTYICQMSSLIVLDIANNTISGHVPNCLHNITTLVSSKTSLNKLSFFFPMRDGDRYTFEDNLELVIKGQALEYGKNLHFMSLIDMSSNNLSGTLPLQMFTLTGLCSLNLSHNKLTGKIPDEIGNMNNLESLDFSTNQLWGEIPQTLSNLSFLSYLNLSFNNFKGKIPLGTQLQGFSALSYIGNRDLCGTPLTNICFQDGKSKEAKQNHDDRSEFLSWFYIGIESGFGTSFFGSLLCPSLK